MLETKISNPEDPHRKSIRKKQCSCRILARAEKGQRSDQDEVGLN